MVVILLGTGFEEAEALVPADLMRRAGIKVALVGVDGAQIAGAHGIAVQADQTLEEIDPEQVELLMLPGGLGGVETIGASPAARKLIRQVWEDGRYVAAICAAPTLLASMGLLKGRRAVCYPGMEGQLDGALPQPDAQVVVDGNLITGQAPGAAFPFALQLLETLKGPDAVEQIKRETHYRG